jgi:DNA polymerase-1
LKKTKTQPSTDEGVLTKLRTLHPVIDLILDYRNAYKIQSTYIDPLLAFSEGDSRVHTTFNQTNTSSGRLSSENPNLQNIPINDDIELRRVFCASNDRVLLVADYSQIELRIMAHITQDEGLIEFFRHDQDIHLATAARIFNKRTDEVMPQERKTGKTINFALMYGMGPHGLSDSLEISRGEAKLYIDGFFRSYPKVKEWQERLLEEVREKGYVETLFGRRRMLPEISDRNFHRRSASERIAINHPLQGTQADIVKMAMVRLDKLLVDENLTSARLLLQVHD